MSQIYSQRMMFMALGIIKQACEDMECHRCPMLINNVCVINHLKEQGLEELIDKYSPKIIIHEPRIEIQLNNEELII